MSFKYSVLAGAAVALLAAGALQAQDALTKDPAQVRAGSYTLDPAHSKITWSVNHLGFSTYTGQFAGGTGVLQIDPKAPQAAKLEVKVDTTQVGTLNEALDKHLKTADFLDVANHPTATFRSTSVKLVDKDTADITGQLTLRGVTKPVTIRADFHQAGVNPLDKTYSLGFDGTTTIKRSDFGVNYAVPMVSDEVTLHLEAEFKLSPAA